MVEMLLPFLNKSSTMPNIYKFTLTITYFSYKHINSFLYLSLSLSFRVKLEHGGKTKASVQERGRSIAGVPGAKCYVDCNL